MKTMNVLAQARDDRHYAPVDCVWGRVVEVTEAGVIWVQISAEPLQAMLSTHIPLVSVGQRVLLAGVEAIDNPVLVIAAYPVPGQNSVVPFSYDSVSDSWQIKAVHLKIVGEREVAIQCGDASFVVSEDGTVSTRGERLLSAAIETNRIEGGSIEFN